MSDHKAQFLLHSQYEWNFTDKHNCVLTIRLNVYIPLGKMEANSIYVGRTNTFSHLVT